ncbi:hypothetical protein BJ742DRAFT_765406 [Cladochytrium replicatum]|nr:hypothetical protein BJ742DRAFT_765406 [Cladochytrium replicatum]
MSAVRLGTGTAAVPDNPLIIAGAQGGVNFNDAPENLKTIRCEVKVTVKDYDEGHSTTTILNNSNFEKFINEPRPSFSKVRWINIQGVDFEVMRALTLRYGLHPLAIEDVFHTPARIKADFYDDHIFTTMLLVNRPHHPINHNRLHIPRPVTKSNWHHQNGDNEHEAQDRFDHYRRLRHRKTMHEWLQRDQLDVVMDLETEIEQANFFLLQDTVISIFSHEGTELTEPISKRIDQEGTMIRELEDPSYILYSLVDGVVDHYLILTDMYNGVIDHLEEKIMKQPKAVYTKTLHLVAKEVRAFKRLLDPTNTLITALKASREELDDQGRQWHRVSVSKTTRIYLSDVHDHMTSVLENLEGLRDEANDLIQYIFNVTSNSTNESMKVLAIFSVFFLPVTFLAGVYGMNFEYFPEVKGAMAIPEGMGLFGNFMYFWVWVGVSIVLSTAFLYISRVLKPTKLPKFMRRDRKMQ